MIAEEEALATERVKISKGSERNGFIKEGRKSHVTALYIQDADRIFTDVPQLIAAAKGFMMIFPLRAAFVCVCFRRGDSL